MLLDVAYRRLVRGDQALSLTPLQCRIVETLARRGGVVSYDHLITVLWQADEPDDAQGTLKVSVCLLRRKLRLGGWPALVVTAWGRGFYLCVPVEVRSAEPLIVIPMAMGASLRRLLWSHPDRTAADQILSVVGA